jgi:uncharacterized protein Smg (DUF494 family)
MSEWYSDENKDVLIYFDNWNDLRLKIATTDFDAQRAKIRVFTKKHCDKMMARWRGVFENILNH